MSSNSSKLSISPPNTFQHVGGSNKPPALQIPPPLRVSTNTTNNNNNNNNNIESPPKSPNITPHQPQLVKSTSNNNIASNGSTTNGQLKKSTSNHNLNINVNNSSSSYGGSLHTQPNKILHNPSPKKTTKSTIISGKLKRFFKNRPTRNSLYENHILSAPFSSATLSFINIFKIITALKKSNAIETEGLFRVNGNAESIRSLWLMLNNVQEAIPVDQNSSPHDLAGLLKLYLRESKFPLIPLELFTQPALPSTVDDARDFVEQKLPTENVRVLSYLIEYLEQVSLKSSLNKMNPIALGVCFAPNTLRSVNTNPVNPQFQVHMTNIQSHCNFITLLIENRSKIFKEAALPTVDGNVNEDEILSTLIIESPTSTNNDQDLLLDEEDENDQENDGRVLAESTSLDNKNGQLENNDGTQSPSQKEISPLYDEFINLLTDDSLGPSQKSVIIQRMTTLFSTDGDRFKAFLRDMQIDGIISLLEYILTLDEN